MSQSYQKKLAISLFLISGTISTFAYKLQGTSKVNEGGVQKNFFHPYIQSFTMFVGQFLCLFLFLLDRKRKRKSQKINNQSQSSIDENKITSQQNMLNNEKSSKKYSPTIFIIPAIADSCSSILQYMGLNFISGSTYLMFKGAAIVTTAIFSKILFNMKIQKRHIAGCVLAIIGIAIVGSSGLLDNSSSTDSSFQKQLIGYVLMLISLIFNGFFYAYQQKLLKKYENQINPLQMVGFQGLYGLCIITTVITILTFVPCSFGKNGCVFNSQGNPFFQRPDAYISQVFGSAFLIVLVILGILTIAIYNLNGLKITKFFDALTRALLNVTKTSIVWAVGVTITIIGNGDQQFNLESLKIIVNLVKGFGFIFIIFGTLIYNKLIFKEFFATDDEKKEKLINFQKEIQNNEKNKQSLVSQQ